MTWLALLLAWLSPRKPVEGLPPLTDEEQEILNEEASRGRY